MPFPVDYETFLASAPDEELSMLSSFLVNVEVFAHTPEAGDTMFAQAMHLFELGVLSSVTRRYFEAGGIENPVTHQGFLGTLAPAAVGYISKMARERRELSTDPLPVQP